LAIVTGSSVRKLRPVVALMPWLPRSREDSASIFDQRSHPHSVLFISDLSMDYAKIATSSQRP
jgi:hypothetical protein